MKIAILIYSLAGGGAEKVVSQLLKYLKEKNIEVILVLMNSEIVYDIPQDIPVHYIENSNPNELNVFKFLKLPILAFKYYKFLRNQNITVSLSFLTRPNYINLIANTNNKIRKIIISERSNPSYKYKKYILNLNSILNNLLISNLFNKSNGIIVNSESNRQGLIKNFGIQIEKTITINNPIDLNKILNTNSVINFYDPNYFNFITVGRLNKDKNHELLIRALANIDNKKIRLYIFGEGKLKKYLENKIIKLNLEKQVFLKGFTNEIFSYLKGADAFIFGSNHEGFPNVLLEAMACGLPLISTNCQSGPSEIMKYSKSNNITNKQKTDYGFLVPVNNTLEMIDAMNETIKNNDYREFCKKNVLIRSNDFKKNFILDQYLDYIIK